MNKNTLKSILAILTGFVSVFLVSIGTDFLLENTGLMVREPFDSNPTWLIVIIVIYRSIYNTLGCYLAARLAPAKPMLHAFILGSIGLLLSCIGTIAMWHIPPHWYPISLIILALPCAWLGGKLRTG